MHLDVLIIGGGIHGVHIAARLIGEAGFSPERLRIVDPADRLLDRWRTCTATTAMTHLRSPSVHNLDLNPWALQRFAGKRKKRKQNLFAAPFDRPALGLFNAHCDRVIDKFGLAELHIQARATACSIECEHVGVELSNGQQLTATNVVLAVGSSEHPEWPAWAPREDERIHHVFDPGFDGWPTSKETIAVIGGGISAAQVALRLLKEGHDVHLVSRHALRKQQFDSEPGWLGPKFMAGFLQEPDFDRRRAMIVKARHIGSIPPDIKRTLHRVIHEGLISWHEGQVSKLDTSGGKVSTELRSGITIETDRALLATGFAQMRPGGALVDQLVASESLCCAQCGYPVVDESLRWHSRIFVSGPLAELELGPAARNIAGARRAANRLVDALHSKQAASIAKAS